MAYSTVRHHAQSLTADLEPLVTVNDKSYVFGVPKPTVPIGVRG